MDLQDAIIRDNPISVRLTKEELAMLDKASKDVGINPNSLIRHILVHGLSELKAQKKHFLEGIGIVSMAHPFIAQGWCYWIVDGRGKIISLPFTSIEEAKKGLKKFKQVGDKF